MKKNAEQYVLTSWMGYLTQPPTWLFQLRRAWKVFTFRIVAIAAVSLFLAESGFRTVAFFAVGMLIGSLLRDSEWMRKTARLWPVVSIYLDWDKIKDAHEALSEKRVEPRPPADA